MRSVPFVNSGSYQLPFVGYVSRRGDQDAE